MARDPDHTDFDPHSEDGPPAGGRLDESEYPPEATPPEPDDAGCCDDSEAGPS